MEFYAHLLATDVITRLLSLIRIFRCWNNYVLCGNIQVIPHFYAEDIPLSKLCKLHGWTIRETPRRVFDAVIFSNEVDILEIRMQVGNKFLTSF